MHAVTIAPLQPALQSVPAFFGFGHVGSCQSALEHGGDFYDVVPLTDSSLLLVIADVMGKGYTASTFAGTLRTLTRALAGPKLCPAECLNELNEVMFDQLSDAELFITMQIVVADLHHHRLKVANAGHCPLLLSGPDQMTRAIAPEGMPLGIQRGTKFCSETLALEPYSSVLLYTDGITEARNSTGSLFGQSRLETWFHLAARRHSTAQDLKASLLEEVYSYQGDPFPADDQTFLILADETPRTITGPFSDQIGWVLPPEAIEETLSTNTLLPLDT